METRTLSVLIRSEHDGQRAWWVAQCLECDIAAQATSLDDLEYELQRELAGRVAVGRKLGVDPFEGLPQAPDPYWRLFSAARKLELARTGAFKPSADGWLRPPAYEARLA